MLFPVIAFAGAAPVQGAAIVRQVPPDPLLDGAADGPCAVLVDGADYAAGTDTAGYPVVPADVDAGPIAVPDQIMVPLHAGGARVSHRHRRAHADGGRSGDSPYVAIDGHRLAPLVNPPACENRAPPR